MTSNTGYAQLLPPTESGSPPRAGSGLHPYIHSPQPSFVSENGTFVEDSRSSINRTPSPTPEEVAALKQKSFFDVTKFLRPKTKKYIIIDVCIVLVLILTILIAVFQSKIVKALAPFAIWMHKLPAGWLLPIFLIIILSFPPLFGADIIATLCGLVWGPWIGFAIVAVGTVLGELITFYIFKRFFSERSARMETKNIQYAALSTVIREGGFKVALITRYSTVPPHFATAIFAACRMNVLTFLAAAVLALPNQFATVYIGASFEAQSNPAIEKRTTIISWVVLGITIAITIVAMHFLMKYINEAKVRVVHDRRKARQSQLLGEFKGKHSYSPSYSSDISAAEDGTFRAPTPVHMAPEYPATLQNYSTAYMEAEAGEEEDTGYHGSAPMRGSGSPQAPARPRS